MKKLCLSILLVLLVQVPAFADNIGSAVADFGFDYFHRTESEGNRAYSPLSIHAIISMLSLGSEGETKSSSLSALKLKEQDVSGYLSFVESLTPRDGSLNLATRVWPTRRDPLSPKYVEACRDAFGAHPQGLDFSHPEAARDEINRWTAEATRDLIKELIPSGALQADTVLALSNALYFKGAWAHPFSESATREAVFHTPNGEKTVPFMRGKPKAYYSLQKEYQAVSLPYAGTTLAMALIMPRKPEQWRSVRSALNVALLEELDRVSDPARESSVEYSEPPVIELRMPKFEISESSKPLPLLKEMGFDKLLSGSGEYSIFENRNAPVVVEDCFHETVIKVHEKGTEAAAATAVLAVRSVPPISIDLIIDRPFFFVIYDRESKAPLFLGQIVDP